ncbi:MAG: tyrosine-type recombinase/integrase [Bacteroidales bacterium]
MISFFLKNSKRDKSSINIRLSIRGKSYSIPTGLSTETKYWNKNSQRIKNTIDNKESTLLNKALNKWNKCGLEVIEAFINSKEPPSLDLIKRKLSAHYYNTVESNEIKFIDYIENWKNQNEGLKSKSTLKKATTTKNILIRYQEDRGVVLYFDNINIEFFRNFTKWFNSKEENYGHNYYAFIITHIKQYFNTAREEKLHQYYLPSDFIASEEEVDNIYLTPKEIERIYNLNVTPDFLREKQNLRYDHCEMKALTYRRVQNLFFIGCYTALRVSDFLTLNDYNFKNGFLYKKTKKTGKSTIIPLHDKIKDIINDGFSFEQRVYPAKMNKLLKDLAKWSNLDDNIIINEKRGGEWMECVYKKYELVTTHTCRRSFATNAYLAGMPIPDIMKFTTHKSIKSFLKYIKVTELENAMKLENHPFFCGIVVDIK